MVKNETRPDSEIPVPQSRENKTKQPDQLVPEQLCLLLLCVFNVSIRIVQYAKSPSHGVSLEESRRVRHEKMGVFRITSRRRKHEWMVAWWWWWLVLATISGASFLRQGQEEIETILINHPHHWSLWTAREDRLKVSYLPTVSDLGQGQLMEGGTCLSGEEGMKVLTCFRMFGMACLHSNSHSSLEQHFQ